MPMSRGLFQKLWGGGAHQDSNLVDAALLFFVALGIRLLARLVRGFFSRRGERGVEPSKRCHGDGVVWVFGQLDEQRDRLFDGKVRRQLGQRLCCGLSHGGALVF